MFDRPIDETEVLFRKLIEKGKMKPCDPRALATLYFSFSVYMYFQTFILNYGEPMDSGAIERRSRAQIKLIVDMLKPEGTQSR